MYNKVIILERKWQDPSSPLPYLIAPTLLTYTTLMINSDVIFKCNESIILKIKHLLCHIMLINWSFLDPLLGHHICYLPYYYLYIKHYINYKSLLFYNGKIILKFKHLICQILFINWSSISFFSIAIFDPPLLFTLYWLLY